MNAKERALAVYRLCLRCYPPGFRARYGDAMVRAAADAWDDRVRRAGRAGAFRSWLPMLLDAIGHGLLEQVAPAEPEPSFDDLESSRHSEGGAMEALLRDLRYAVRGLVRRPSFTGTAVATLAVAIGFNTTLFSVVRGVLLEPLPYADPGRLLVLQESHPEHGVDGVSAPDFTDWRARATLLEDLAAFQYWGFTLTGGDEPLEVPSMKVTPGLFPLLGVEPALGRAFSAGEGEAGRDKVVVISHELWQGHFGGSPGILGRVVDLDSEPFEVVGVMAPGFEFPPDHDARIWSALGFDPNDRRHDGNRNVRNLGVMARRHQDAELEQVRQELDRIAAGIAGEHPESNLGWGIVATGAHEQLVGGVRTTLVVLAGAVGLLLLIACANLANLTLARLASRQREIAVRTGLGAARRHLVRQFLAESTILAFLGALAGLGLAAFGVRWIRGFSNEVLPRLSRIEIDAGVAFYTFGLCLLTAVLFGLAPALRASGSAAAEHLKSRMTAPLASQRMFGGLVVSQVALALVLMVGAGLMVRSFARLADVDPGFRADGALAANVFLPRATYTRAHQKKAFFDRMLEELRAAPGVESAAAVTALPMDEVGINFDLPFEIEGRPKASAGEEPQADFRVATPGYFETLRIPLVRGRSFDERDREDASRVMLINQTMARRFFPGEDPVGRFVSIPMGGRHEVVGVVTDLKHYGLANETRPEMYVAFAQQPFGGMTVVLRTPGEPSHYSGLVKRAAQTADPAQAVYQITPVRALLDRVLFMPRLRLVILGLFAVCSCLLASVGLYGVMASMVARRTREIGIRLALGAGTDAVMWMVVRRGMTLAAAGIASGLAFSLGLTRLLGSLLFEVDPLDPSVLALAGLGFAVVTFVANVVPAVRAMRVDPVVTLSAE